MSTATPPILKYSTRCRVPGCNQEFSSSPLDIPIIGQPHERVVKFVTGLLAHLQKKHPEEESGVIDLDSEQEESRPS